jgi:hypothetical protein
MISLMIFIIKEEDKKHTRLLKNDQKYLHPFTKDQFSPPEWGGE